MNVHNTPESCDDEKGWFVSSFSNASGSCVEVRFAERGTVMVRDSKDRRGYRPVIGVSSLGWARLMGMVTRSG